MKENFVAHVSDRRRAAGNRLANTAQTRLGIKFSEGRFLKKRDFLLMKSPDNRNVARATNSVLHFVSHNGLPTSVFTLPVFRYGITLPSI